jgi:hypothetical protein
MQVKDTKQNPSPCWHEYAFQAIVNATFIDPFGAKRLCLRVVMIQTAAVRR